MCIRDSNTVAGALDPGQLAREQPVPGVTAKLVVDAVAELRPGMPLAYEPTLEDAADYLRARVRAGDLILTVGAGDVRRVGDLLLG